MSDLIAQLEQEASSSSCGASPAPSGTSSSPSGTSPSPSGTSPQELIVSLMGMMPAMTSTAMSTNITFSSPPPDLSLFQEDMQALYSWYREVGPVKAIEAFIMVVDAFTPNIMARDPDLMSKLIEQLPTPPKTDLQRIATDVVALGQGNIYWTALMGLTIAANQFRSLTPEQIQMGIQRCELLGQTLFALASSGMLNPATIQAMLASTMAGSF